jgi:hypothetical protein
MSKYGMSLTDNHGVVRIVYYNVITAETCGSMMTRHILESMHVEVHHVITNTSEC